MRTIEAVRRFGARTRPAVVVALVLATLLGVGAPAASAAPFPSPGGGTRQVIGAILAHYSTLGGPVSFLGGPLTDELPTPNGIGRFNHFQGGSIYWTPPTGAHEVHGLIRERWAGLGWETSFLGFPTTDELPTPNGIGRFNHFQGGSIYWSPITGAHVVAGAIRDRWASLGWENSTLGFPTSDEYAIPGGRGQDFQRGSIRWTPTGGAVVAAGLPLGATPPGTQLITVAAPSAGSTTATLTAWQLGANGWQPVIGPAPARIGSDGVGAASETSTRTPAGQFGLTEAFGRAGNPGTALPYRVIDGNDWWVSDTRSPLYNQYARCAPGTCPFDEGAGENLGAAGAVYDNAVVIDYNRAPAVPGAGSAFFLHISNGAATAGCVAVDRVVLQQVLRWLDPRATPIIAIGVG